MRTYLIGAALAAALAVTGSIAPAQTAKATATAPKAAKAGPATRAEMQSRLATLFAKVDTNRDGFVTKAELDALEAQREQKLEQRAARFDPAKIFARLDANKDGKITVAEADAARSQRSVAKGGKPAHAQATAFSGLFARADANKDGAITRAEFDTLGQQLKGKLEHAGAAQAKLTTRLFDNADANKDGRVTLAEMQQAALARFDKADANHDGKITPDERSKLRPAARKPVG